MSITFKDICNHAAAAICHNNGATIEEIAKQAKVSPATVRKWISLSGLSKRRGKGGAGLDSETVAK